MERLKVCITGIIFRNEDNYYSVLEASGDGGDVTVVGHFPDISEGETIEAEGSYKSHPVYGSQFSVISYIIIPPEGEAGILRYLSGGAIRGIGPALAKRIVKKFKSDTFRIIEEEPERLAEIKGISEPMAMRISEQAQIKKGLRDAVMFMQEYGIGMVNAGRIYERYGPRCYDILKSNPYRLAEEIEGIGFKTADRVALRMGVAEDSPFRIRCGLLYALAEAAQDGHTCLPLKLLEASAAQLLGLKPGDTNSYLRELQIAGSIVAEEKEDDVLVFLSAYYYTEAEIAARLHALAVRGETEPGFARERLRRIERETGIELDEMQREAVTGSLENGVLVLTGGPGTGKTTTIRALIRLYQEDHREILLAAPTGRAARRMSEAAGYEAKTIHRMLEYTGAPEEGNAPGDQARYEGRFLRDEKDPLEADVIIIDEMSMVDIFLMKALLRAVVPGTRLILVGDCDQLPPVGPGNVLRDIVGSGYFRTVRLTHIFRQAAVSDIIVNAHRINHGEPVDLSKKSRDFLFIRNSGAEEITGSICRLITDKLPGYVGCEVPEVQVLTATRKGALGVEGLNRELQARLNPPSAGRRELKTADGTLREGDKVMQTKNDYDLEWTVYDKKGLPKEQGSGVFNGDIGRIAKIDVHAEIVSIVFDEARHVKYDKKHLQNVELAYAVTVHKSQGSEYPAVVMPMFRAPRMLMNRNLLYTAVTRARKCVCMVGLPGAFEEMEMNEDENKRYSGLMDRIAEGCRVSGEMSGMR